MASSPRLSEHRATLTHYLQGEKKLKLHYDGSFEVSASKEASYAFAIDPAKITTIFPDVQDIRIIDPETFELKTKIGISFIKGMMNVKGSITEKIPSKFVKSESKGKWIGKLDRVGKWLFDGRWKKWRNSGKLDCRCHSRWSNRARGL